jgi:DNA-binding HxlR family transcriptional regulator
MNSEHPERTPRRKSQIGMSYKFQRLREKIRQAVASGELSAKLPGERELARRFQVNAKTLSKALTDLAAEGLLHRSIGRGTFVKGSEIQPTTEGPWLVLCDQDDADSELVRLLINANAGSQTAQPIDLMRPSFLNQFTAVIDMASGTPNAFHRDLVVRNMPVVIVDRQPKHYSTNAVMIDTALGTSYLARDLMLAGHRRFAAVESQGRTTIAETLRKSAQRYAPDATVDSCYPRETATMVDQGVTAIVCESAKSASEALKILGRLGVQVPQAISVAAVGRAGGSEACTGYFVSPEAESAAIVDLLTNGTPARPTTIWLSGQYFDSGTTGTRSHLDIDSLPPAAAKFSQASSH